MSKEGGRRFSKLARTPRSKPLEENPQPNPKAMRARKGEMFFESHELTSLRKHSKTKYRTTNNESRHSSIISKDENNHILERSKRKYDLQYTHHIESLPDHCKYSAMLAPGWAKLYATQQKIATKSSLRALSNDEAFPEEQTFVTS